MSNALDERRNLLQTQPNNNTSQDFLVQQTLRLNLDKRNIIITLRMIPDKEVLSAESLVAYCENMKSQPTNLETWCGAFMDDLLNVLIPRFLHIEFIEESDSVTTRIIMEEKQPKWSNQALLARLAPL